MTERLTDKTVGGPGGNAERGACGRLKSKLRDLLDVNIDGIKRFFFGDCIS